MKKSDELKLQRTEKAKKAADLHEKADGEKRQLTTEEQEEFDGLMDEVDELTLKIGEAEGEEKRAADAQRARLLSGAAPTQPVEGSEGDQRDLQRFSLHRSVRIAMGEENLDGIEREVHEEAMQEASQISGVNPGRGIGVSQRAMRSSSTGMQPEVRAQTAGTGSEGGYTIDTEYRGFIPALRNQAVAFRAGARLLGGLTSNITLSKGTGLFTASWKSENAQADETTLPFGQVTMAPKRLTAMAPISNQLILQSSEDINGMINGELINAAQLTLDSAIINGSGVDPVPLGLLNTVGIGNVAGGPDGSIPTWDDSVGLMYAITAKNAPMDRPVYVTTPGVKAQYMVTRKDAGSGVFVIDSEGRTLKGNPIIDSNIVPSNLVKGASGPELHALIHGDWRNVIVLQWGGMYITVDSNSAAVASKNQTVVVINSFWNSLVRYPEAFAAKRDCKVDLSQAS